MLAHASRADVHAHKDGGWGCGQESPGCSHPPACRFITKRSPRRRKERQSLSVRSREFIKDVNTRHFDNESSG